MSLATNTSDLSTRVATEVKALRTLLNGNALDLSGLDTTAQGNLVAAINEVLDIAESAAGGGVSINDAAINTTQTWSSSKIDSEIDASVPTWSTLAGKPVVIGAGATPAEARTAISAAADDHDHVVVDITDFDSAVDARIESIVDAAPAALDTLNELAAALNDDPNFHTTITNALGLRVAVTAQTFDATQRAQARTNIDAASATDVGDTTTDFVAVFEAGLV